ncbi:MAG: sigma-70 family RNA polymerase sigma factor [Saprospiraceae bacterium]|nr:sigma-70 family RNA polymerase sigma factor [Saprospiraceae bacterium]
MLNLGRRFTRDEDKLVEWINNGFLKVFKKIHTVNNPEALPGWIRSVVYRSILDGIRSEKRYLTHVIVDSDYKLNGTYDLASGYDYEVLLKHVELLPDSSKKVFKLFVLEGFSHKDISERIGISEGTSKWHLNNARKKLKEILIQNKIIAVG